MKHLAEELSFYIASKEPITAKMFQSVLGNVSLSTESPLHYPLKRMANILSEATPIPLEEVDEEWDITDEPPQELISKGFTLYYGSIYDDNEPEHYIENFMCYLPIYYISDNLIIIKEGEYPTLY